ncbi:peptidoglycan-binding protein [Peterkaempfera sp. SMS 1(5)a]|uniref:peptidoglycan-binding domain-containing protein n=1 Tax=Peterkaempfera podocarpi TaxID=3232308 RepID=UPI00366F025B
MPTSGQFAPLVAAGLVAAALAWPSSASAEPGTVGSLSSSECPTNIVKGSTNSWCVSTLQSVLQQLGFDLSVDGQFGDQTLAAVKWVQTKAHLQDSSVGVDGQVGPVTKRWLETFIDNQVVSLGDGCGLDLITSPNSGSGTAQAYISEYAADGAGYCTGTLFRSTDGGRSWTAVSGEHTEANNQSVTTYAYADTSTELAKVCGTGTGPNLVDSGCTAAF